MSDYAYLDYAASTPLDPRVGAAMTAAAQLTGNPSSTHAAGRDLRTAIDAARRQVARLLGVSEEGIVFTSGATEANGLAIRGVLRSIRATHFDAARNTNSVAGPRMTPRVLISAIEHASVLGSALAAEADGEAVVDLVAPDQVGVVTASAVAAALTADTAVVSVQWANNVLGTIQPVAEIGAVVVAERQRRAAAGENLPLVFVCDAVQALRTEDVRPQEAGVDILTMSAHKIYGPKGVGAMWLRTGTPYAPPYGGGGHESGRRHGTENAEGIVGLGTAAELLVADRTADRANALTLRKRLLDSLAERLPSALVVGGSGAPGIVFMTLPKAKGDELALKLDMAGIAVSAGSACDAGKRKSPRALEAVLDEQTALRGGIRVSFGRFTTNAEIDSLVAALGKLN